MLLGISPPHLESLPENQTERWMQDGEKERDVFLDIIVQACPAIHEAGTSSGLGLGGNKPPPLLKPVALGFLFFANRAVVYASTQHSDAPPPLLQGLSERPGYWGWPAIALCLSVPHTPDLGRKQTPRSWFWGPREGSV